MADANPVNDKAAAKSLVMAETSGKEDIPVVVAVVGTTGVGKSNLAIELAKRFQGEVINADSMQVYRGLDIVTNKVTAEEQAMVPHHLLSFVDPAEEYSVSQFERDCTAKIQEIHSRGRIPILVGGTHYYIQAVLWRASLIRKPSLTDITKAGDSNTTAAAAPVQSVDQTDQLDEVSDGEHPKQGGVRLRNLIPHPSIPSELANRIVDILKRSSKAPALSAKEALGAEPSDEVIQWDGVVSELGKMLAEVDSGLLRYWSIIFWVWSENATLDKRLDSRVDSMINQGLFQELLDMWSRIPPAFLRPSSNQTDEGDSSKPNQSLLPDMATVDFTRGILQAIGFKEFAPYLFLLELSRRQTEVGSASNDEHAVKDGLSMDSRLAELRDKGVESMKTGTRRYARRQVTWIKNKLAKLCERDGVGLYALDATDLSAWHERVADEAERIMKAFLDGQSPSNTDVGIKLLTTTGATQSKRSGPPNGDISDGDDSATTATWGKRYCNVCVDRVTGEPKLLHGEREWQIHINSSKHKRKVKGIREGEKRKAAGIVDKGRATRSREDSDDGKNE
ncbi:hypothetical protein HDU96_006559 [Phlyctochytrium bullatum]|nr:hypothetical protein HDU96_006559 [Phlyctochytrium bullatum]